MWYTYKRNTEVRSRTIVAVEKQLVLHILSVCMCVCVNVCDCMCVCMCECVCVCVCECVCVCVRV
jgi:hypothetical protein